MQEGKQMSKGIQVQKPSLPKGGGSVQGMGETFAPNEFSGSAAMNIPLPISACREFEPVMSLNYSIGNGNSAFGLGWELSTPEIVRRTSNEIPHYTNDDTFLYTTEDYLVPRMTTSGTPILRRMGNYTVYTYMPRTEGNFDKMEHFINKNDHSDDFWKITDADNVVSIFGKSKNAKIFDPENPNHIFKWLLEEAYNDRGDHQIYQYEKENGDNITPCLSEVNRDQQTQTYLSKVFYGNFSAITDGAIVTGESATRFNHELWHFEVVFDYGTYVIDPSNPTPHTVPPTITWPSRLDPFSDYSAGFEIRTYRLCKNILQFHRFNVIEQEPVLTKALTLCYEKSSVLATLINAKVTGYQFIATGSAYQTKSLPDLSFKYNAFALTENNYQTHAFETLLSEDERILEQGANQPFYQLVDLYGEGIPGILYNDGQSVTYRAPIHVSDVNVSYDAPCRIDFPNANKIPILYQALTDVTGDGKLDLMLSTSHQQGYYELVDKKIWSNFRPFKSFPTNYNYPDNDLIDVTGDGIADVLLIEPDKIQFNASLREDGFLASIQKQKESTLPSSKSNSPSELLFYADMIGSGLSQRVRITQGMVTCWPNLGYGKFGNKITMGDAPNFGSDFDTSRLLWADINGSGTTDLAYIHATHIDIYINQSGNSFSQIPIKILLPAAYDNFTQIQFADIKGNGTNCLVFSKTNPTTKLWYYDFNLTTEKDSAGVEKIVSKKPYLLSEFNTNMGSRTTIEYVSSVQFYLKDKLAGIPWITNLPFPVNVIKSITHDDEISLTAITSSYAYSHGYYDGYERIFRGFGRVDRTDSSTFNNFVTAINGDEAAYNAPNLITKTWYHTGAFIEEEDLQVQFQREFWNGDEAAMKMPSTHFSFITEQPFASTMRDGYRTLQGSVLRTELYGNDDSPWQQTPYTVSETQFEVKEIQQLFSNTYNAFIIYTRQNIVYDYERNAGDPRINHEFMLAYNNYGKLFESCTVNYPRRSANIPVTMDSQTKEQQLRLWVVYAVQTWFNSLEANTYWNNPSPQNQLPSNGYLIGLNIESKEYEIANLVVDETGYFSWQQIETYLVSEPSQNANLLTWDRNYFFDTASQQELRLNNIVAPALHHRTEFVTFTIAKLQTAFDFLPELQFQRLLTVGGQECNGAQGGYIQFSDGEESSYYWNPGSSQSYNHSDSFYLPKTFFDPYQYPFVYWEAPITNNAVGTDYTYDPFLLYVQKVVDPFGNTFSISSFDYQFLYPITVIDINENESSVLLDPLGFVIATAEKGTQAGQNVGFADLKSYTPLSNAQIIAILEQPNAFMGMEIANVFHYNLNSWKEDKIPPHFVTIVRNDFSIGGASTASYQIDIEYRDGFNRDLQHKIYYDGNNEWLTSGTVRYDDKGQVIKKFEPYFDPNYQFGLIEEGVSLTLYYDALGRGVLTRTQEGFYEKTLFGTLNQKGTIAVYNGYLNKKLYANIGVFAPNVWSSLSYDKNDSLKDSSYVPVKGENIDPDAFNHALLFANTPFEHIEDSMGRVVQSEQLNVSNENEKNLNYFTFDILGNELTSADQRLQSKGVNNFECSYDLNRKVAKEIAVDAGIKWILHNVVGDIFYLNDSNGTQQFYSYDVLHRPIELFVESAELAISQKVKWMIYGDSRYNGTPYFSNTSGQNLRGKLVINLDEAGLSITPSFDTNNLALISAKWLKIDYKNEANWNTLENETLASLATTFQGQYQPSYYQGISLPTQLSSLLEIGVFVSSENIDAIGRVVNSTDVDGNVSTPQYYSTNWIKGLKITPGSVVINADSKAEKLGFSNVQYNARAQRTTINYLNDTKTKYEYDVLNFELTKIKTTLNNSVIQHLQYHHDPVGNVSAMNNLVAPTVFFNNQQVDSKAQYTYNSLYQLIQATGREHAGMRANTQSNQNKFNSTFFGNSKLWPQLSQGTALQNYTLQYQYDEAGNLILLNHINNNSSTRKTTIHKKSNRIQSSRLGSLNSVNYSYDNNGNMTSLEGCQRIKWNYRNNMQCANRIERAADINDAEYYVYNGAGQRVRKVHEQKTTAGTIVKEVIYLGGIEVRKSYLINAEGVKNTMHEWHVAKLEDDTDTFCIWRYWVAGAISTGEKKVQQRYQLNDVLNSSCYELDEKGNKISYEEYYPYGGTSIIAAKSEKEVKAKHYHYSAKEKDGVTGLYYYGMRYYAPWLGRWTCTDPAGTVDGLNVYAFVEGNPLTNVDLGGMACTNCNGTGHNRRSCVSKKGKKENKKEKKIKAGKRKQATTPRARLRGRKSTRANKQSITMRDSDLMFAKSTLRKMHKSMAGEVKEEGDLHGHKMLLRPEKGKLRLFRTAKAGGRVKRVAPKWMQSGNKAFNYDLMKFLSHTEGKLFSEMNSIKKFEELATSHNRKSGSATFDLHGHLAMCFNCQKALLSLQLHPAISMYYKKITFNYWADNHTEQIPGTVRGKQGSSAENKFEDDNGVKHHRIINHYFSMMSN